MVSDSKRRANEKYTARNYEQIAFRVRKGIRAEWKCAAEKRGLSLAGLIVTAVTEYLQAHPVADDAPEVSEK